MKKSVLFFLAAFFLLGAIILRFPTDSQTEPNSTKNEVFQPVARQNVAFAVSAPVASFAPAQPEIEKTSRKGERARPNDDKMREIKNKQRIRQENLDAVHDADAAIAETSAGQMPTPSLTFEGLSSLDTALAYGFRATPPDPTGDVGGNFYIQATNLLVRIYNKNNGQAVTPPFKLSQIYAPLNTTCSRRDDGDPIVLYDALADRWLLSSFCTAAPPFRQMIAVSKTGDPTGAYYVYEFVMPNFKLNDYSKLGVWRDAFLMSSDQFIGSDFAGTGAFAFDKEKMLRGDASAGYVYFDLASPSIIRLGGMLPADLDGLRPPPPNAPGIFASYTATEYGDAADAIKLFEIRPNFANPNLSTFTERAESPIAVAAFDPTSAPDRADIAQPAPGEILDAQSDRLMYRVAYRNFGATESLVFNQTVRASATGENYRAGVRLYELRKPSNGAFTVQNQATAAFDNINRWMGSAAQDNQGNIAVGYSTANAENKPSIVYTGRAATDAPNTLRGEEFLQLGKGVQTGFGFRWGDYSTMSVDPSDDCTFWYTNEYYSEESEAESPFGWLTRVGKFRFAECQNIAKGSISGTITNAANGQTIANAVVKTVQGFERATNAEGNFNLTVLPDVYEITASARGFRSQTITINIAENANLTQNFTLQPIVVGTNAGISFAAESCALNGAIEPGETVTVNLTIRNDGAVNANALTTTLTATGGVTNPSQPQNFGALGIGQTTTRPFTFTAQNSLACGAEIALTFQLTDGAENLGTITQIYNAGAPKMVLREYFDRTPANKMPFGWTTTTTGGQEIWRTLRGRSAASYPNQMFSPESFQTGVNELVSPQFAISTATAKLKFRNKYDLESTFLRNKLYDGGVLEIKIGNGEFQDIIAAGGNFISGGYDGVLDSCCQNPLAGRRAWSSRSGINNEPEFVTSEVTLPPTANGQNVRLRWRVATDVGGRRQGQWIDNVEVTDGFVCNCGN